MVESEKKRIGYINFVTNNNNNKIGFALLFTVILIGSITLTGPALAKVPSNVSLEQPQQQQQQAPLKLWSIDPRSSSIDDHNTGIDPPKAALPDPPYNSTKPSNATKTSMSNVLIVKNITNIKGPVKVNFVNSYWTYNTAQDQFVAGTTSARTQGESILPVIKQEVGPGEGPSLLAVVLINEGFSSITGITSSLDLPSGFEPLITPKSSSIPGSQSQTALSSYDGVVEPGRAFTLYFGVKVLGNAQVDKQYTANLKLGYVKVTELRQKHFRSETITVPFTISGKVILDAVSSSPSVSSVSNLSSLTNSSSLLQTINLIPGYPNAVKLTIKNDGSATARGVIFTAAGVTAASVSSTSVTVSTTNVTTGVAPQPSSSSTVILGSKVFSIGTISPGGSQQISIVIYPSITAAGTVQTLNLALSFNDAYGNRKNTNQLVGLQILPISPQSGLSVSPFSPPTSSRPPSSPSTPPSSPSSALQSNSTNRSPVTSGANVGLTKLASLVRSSSTVNNGNASNTNNNNNNNNDLNGKVDPPSPSANLSPPTPPSSSHNSSLSPIQITAGKIQNLTFTINNDNEAISLGLSGPTNSITDLAVSLVSQSPSVKILGPSSWNLPSISSGSGQELTTQVFASPSLIGIPAAFTVNMQYIQNDHQVRTSSFDLGAMVVGDIQLDVNNLGIRYIGNTPNLVGNILNEGNTPARFASLEMITQGQGQGQGRGQTSFYLPSTTSNNNNNVETILMPNSSKYLGNLAVNSPAPFSIPLTLAQVPIAKSQQDNSGIATNKNMKEKMPSLTRIALNSSAVQSNSSRTDDKAAPDTYPVLLNITYSDDLKNIHQIVLSNPVVIRPQQQPVESPFQGGGLYVILIGAAAAVGFAMILIRGRLKSNRKDNFVSEKILEGIDHNGKKGIEDSNSLINSPHPLDEKKAGAPISTS